MGFCGLCLTKGGGSLGVLPRQQVRHANYSCPTFTIPAFSCLNLSMPNTWNSAYFYMGILYTLELVLWSKLQLPWLGS